ncbi:Abi family protein [Flavobacterium cyanobacteriorum]|nr:Abi family protein [Flavobacterium cyanobacteriorum]
MQYKKAPITITEQIEQLQARGLEIANPEKAAHYLSNISYYRLRAYTYPFQDNDKENQPFNRKISFDDIIHLYVFDRQLRLLVFNAIEKIEIAFRTKVIYHFSLDKGAFWYVNPSLFNNPVQFANDIAKLQEEINRSKETFIKHYHKTYTDPKVPPCWMALEVSSIGLLSKIFSNLKENKCKDAIAKHFGLKDVGVLENWLRCISLLRNLCAHHCRIWNRRMTKLAIPKKPIYDFIENKHIIEYKLYAYLCTLQYLLNIISPEHSFKKNLIALMGNCPLAQEKEMGFPKNWNQEQFWK